MKIGTDGVLLGAWAGLDHQPGSLLDIGAGTGLIALMLAQRMGDLGHDITIDAVERDAAAFEQCVDNFEASPWADRLFCYHATLREFLGEVDDRYDSVVSNPPFHTGKAHAGNSARAAARQNQFLPYEELLEAADALVAPSGIFSTIIPFTDETAFIRMASRTGLFPKRITRVRGRSTADIKRSLLDLRFKETAPHVEELTIETGRHIYTDTYKELTRDFYLKL